MKREIIVLLLTGFVAACGPPPDPLPPPAPEEGFQISMQAHAPAGQEVWRCKVEILATDQLFEVNRARHVQSPGMHHMDVMVILENLGLQPGEYDCKTLYDQQPKLMEQIIIYASQKGEDTIQLPPNVSAPIPPGVTVMTEIHYVNASNRDEDVFTKINAYGIEQSTVKERIWGGAIRDLHLEIPPMSTHTEWTRCEMNRDIDLLFLASHTHELGVETKIFAWDGQKTGAELYVNRDWQSPSLKAFAPTPMRVPAGQGFEFRCDFRSDRPTPTRWGFSAKDEMCQIAIVHTPGDVDIKCKIVASSDGMGIE
jgi:hypothetical protein